MVSMERLRGIAMEVMENIQRPSAKKLAAVVIVVTPLVDSRSRTNRLMLVDGA